MHKWQIGSKESGGPTTSHDSIGGHLSSHKYHPFLFKPPQESHPLHNRCDWFSAWFRSLLKYISGLVTHVHHQLCSLAVEQVSRQCDYLVGIVHHCDNIVETSVSTVARCTAGKVEKTHKCKDTFTCPQLRFGDAPLCDGSAHRHPLSKTYQQLTVEKL